MSVLVWIEQSKSGVVANSWEVLGAGRKVADALGTSLVAAVIGSDTAAAAAEASTYGADTVLTLSSPALASLTVIAIGTSLPELATAIAGARKGEDDIAIGNIIGSNIFNIAIVMGLPALISPGPFNPLAFSRDYGVMLLVSVIFALLCWRRQRQIGKGAGALLTGGFIVWMAMLYWLSPLLSG